ncbi:hypothetical protein LJB68_10540, partial [bacterium 210820-DFI.6.52]|nr:hypothetical protein [bacterium 210820-DFI.6.52]
CGGEAELFQSTHPRGVRPEGGGVTINPPKFQSTHPRGVRQNDDGDLRQATENFNPRTRVGCDSKHTQKHTVVCAFNIPSPQTLVNFLASIFSSFSLCLSILQFFSANPPGNLCPLGLRTALK